MYPKPDRSSYKPQHSRTDSNPALDIGWDEGMLSDGRSYRVEAWAEDGVTMLTYFFSTFGLENYSNRQFADLFEREELIRFLDDQPRVTAFPVTDASGNHMWAVNVAVAAEDDWFAHDYTRLRPYRIQTDAA